MVGLILSPIKWIIWSDHDDNLGVPSERYVGITGWKSKGKLSCGCDLAKYYIQQYSTNFQVTYRTLTSKEQCISEDDLVIDKTFKCLINATPTVVVPFLKPCGHFHID